MAGCFGGGGTTSSTDGRIPVNVSVSSTILSNPLTVTGSYTSQCSKGSSATWSLQIDTTGSITSQNNIILDQADINNVACRLTVTTITVTSTSPGVDYTPATAFTVPSFLTTPPGVFTTTASSPPFPQIVFNGTLIKTGSNSAAVMNLHLYFALTAASLNTITGAGSYSVTPTASNIPAPTFGYTTAPNSILGASGGYLANIVGGYEFTDSGVGASSIIVYGPVGTTSGAYAAGNPVYDLCQNLGSDYATVDNWYTDFTTGGNTGGGFDGNGSGTSWNLAYGAAGTVGSITYQYGLGYVLNALAPISDNVAVVFHYNASDIDTFQVYCIAGL
jgi:hypothetical protein